MPVPNPFPCGGPGQKPCPPQPATQINPGDVIEYKGKKYVIDDKDEENQDEQ